MNKIIIVGILASSILMGIEAKQSVPKKVFPITKPNIKAKYVEHNNYYTNVTSDCEKYIDIIGQKDQEIEALKKELHLITSKKMRKGKKSFKKNMTKN